MAERYLRQLQLGPMANFVYLLGAADSKECVVVDPAWDVPAIISAAEQDGRRIAASFISHGHFDHINGLPQLLARFAMPVYAQREEVAFFEVVQELGDAVKPVGPGEEIEVAGLKMRCVHTPGHTPGSQCIQTQGTLYTGDTLFMGACGRCDLPGGNVEQMFDSLSKLRALDPRTIIYPGHDYGPTKSHALGAEMRVNPYLKLAEKDAFVAYRNGPRG